MISKKRSLRSFMVCTLTAVLALGSVVYGSSKNTAKSPDGEWERLDDGTIIDPEYFGGKYDKLVEPTYGRFVNQRVEFKPGTDFDNNIWVEEYESILGIKINTLWTVEGLENYNTKLNLIITSGDIPDITVVNAAQFEKLAKAGMIQEIGPSIDEYATEPVKEALKAYDSMALTQCTIDDKIMAFPTASAGPGEMNYMFIRDDWRQELGLEVPKTMDDLYALAKAFVDAGFSENGATYGLGISNQPFETYFAPTGFFNGYGAYPDIWVEKDGELAYGGIQPEMKTALLALNKFYEDGLIDNEFIVKDSWTVSTDAVAGNVGICYGRDWLLSWPLIDGYRLNGAEWKAYTIPFDENVSEQSIQAKSKLNDGGFIVVRSGFEYPEIVVKMINHHYDRVYGGVADLNVYKSDGSWDFLQFAAIKTTIGINKNELIAVDVTDALDNENMDALSDQEREEVYGYVKSYIDGVDEIELLGEEDGRMKNGTNWLFYNLEYGSESIHQLPLRWAAEGMIKIDEFWGPNTPEIETKWGILRDNETAMILDIITEEEDIDYFDDYVETWLKLGGEQITKEVNEWYNSR